MVDINEVFMQYNHIMSIGSTRKDEINNKLDNLKIMDYVRFDTIQLDKLINFIVLGLISKLESEGKFKFGKTRLPDNGVIYRADSSNHKTAINPDSIVMRQFHKQYRNYPSWFGLERNWYILQLLPLNFDDMIHKISEIITAWNDNMTYKYIVTSTYTRGYQRYKPEIIATKHLLNCKYWHGNNLRNPIMSDVDAIITLIVKPENVHELKYSLNIGEYNSIGPLELINDEIYTACNYLIMHDVKTHRDALLKAQQLTFNNIHQIIEDAGYGPYLAAREI
jgi:hypothetical protein